MFKTYSLVIKNGPTIDEFKEAFMNLYASMPSETFTMVRIHAGWIVMLVGFKSTDYGAFLVIHYDKYPGILKQRITIEKNTFFL